MYTTIVQNRFQICGRYRTYLTCIVFENWYDLKTIWLEHLKSHPDPEPPLKGIALFKTPGIFYIEKRYVLIQYKN